MVHTVERIVRVSGSGSIPTLLLQIPAAVHADKPPTT